MTVSSEERLKLWVRAGGICTICKTYLLESALTGREVTRGEFAHNVGRKKSTRSPRGMASLPEGERDTADNAVLLCPTCHTEVDDLHQLDLFDVEKLFRLKREHEDFIRDATSRPSSRRTVVLRVRGFVRGAADDLHRDAALDAIFGATDRFPSFPFADRVGVEIDLRGIPGEEAADADYYRAAARSIDEVVERSLRPAAVENHVPHLSVFGLARIALLVHLGSRLDDTIPCDVYQRHRAGQTWVWPDDGTMTLFRHRQESADYAPGTEAVLVLNASGTIHLDELPREVQALTRFVIEPGDTTPHPDIISTRETLASFEGALRGLLSELEATHKSVRRLHVFAAAPVSAAVTLGRSVSWGIHPSLALYDRTDDGYKFALEVSAL